MQPTFILKSLNQLSRRFFSTVLIFILFTSISQSQVLISEDFTTVSPLPAGWAKQNLSSPVGATGWFQGDLAAFSAQSGTPTSYIAADFDNTTGANTISNWLFAPNITLKNGDIFTFYTRVPTGASYPDRLQVRMSTNGASVDAGSTATSVGDFTTLLLDINPTYDPGTYPEDWTLFSITISGLASPTSGRLAFRYFVEDGGPAGANSYYIGIDNVVYTTFATGCSGTPVPGNTISSVANICPAINFNLSLENSFSAAGITYQWQSSTAGAGGPFTDIGGATSSTLTISQSVATWYLCNVTCTNSSSTGTSTPIGVAISSGSGCYCTPPASDCTDNDVITNVKLNTLNNSSVCGTGPPPGYTSYISTVAAPLVFSGASNPITVDAPPDYPESIGVWVDYNQNGQFEASEFTLVGNKPPGGTSVTNNIVIPPSALNGTTRMRVRIRFNIALTGNDACTGYSFGETEDYYVNITPCVQGVFAAHPPDRSIQCSGNTTFTVAATGSLLAWSWEYRVSSSSPSWQTVTDGGVYSGATTSALTLTNVPTTMSGYQYRAIMQGGCTVSTFSNVGTLTVTPLIATVSPTSKTICTGDIQQLSLTNASSPATVSFTNNTSLPIPDNTPAGVFSTISVSGIPAGAVISNVTVKLNITHSYVGDLEITLKAPNGNLLNLVGELDNGIGSNGTADFVNTEISSTGTVPLSGAPAPRTGIFAADRLQGYGPSGAYQTASNGVSWNTMTSTMNGNWILGLSDWYAVDVGTLNNWTISITYGAPASGVWSSNPSSPNTMFTDASATVPYTGTAVTSIYVKPTANTVYSVVYSTGTPCTSPSVDVPITVVSPPTISANPTNKSACVGSSTSFTVSASSSGSLTYQWQVSTDGGNNYSNITGATSSTLNLTGITQSMNNNRYRVNLSSSLCVGTTTSAVAILTVNPLPTVTITASPDTLVRPQLVISITAVSTPAGAAYAWTFNGAPLAGATTSTVSCNVDGIGTYKVTVTDVNGCVNISSPITITGKADYHLYIYPNPAPKGQFQVRRYSAITYDYRTINIYTLSGKRVYTKELATTGPWQRMDINLGGVVSGIYVVEVADRNDNKKVVGKVMIQQ